MSSGSQKFFHQSEADAGLRVATGGPGACGGLDVDDDGWVGTSMAMMFGFGKKKQHHVVATVLVVVDGDAFQPLLALTARAAQTIISAQGDFDTASRKLADVSRALLDHEVNWSAAALGGDVYDTEEDAAGQVADVYADLSSRYSGSANDDDSLPRETGTGTSNERRCVVMLTCSYEGQNDDVERELHDRLDLARVLKGIVALHERGALSAAHLHVAPAHPDDRLTDEQLLALFPEVNPL